MKKLIRGSNNKNYAGCLDYWTGKQLGGWACCFDKKRSINITVIFENGQTMQILANKPRPDIASIFGDNFLHSGFSIDINEQENSNVVKVIFSGTTKQLNNSPMLKADEN